MSDDVVGMADRLRCWAVVISGDEGRENAFKELGDCAEEFDRLRVLLSEIHRSIHHSHLTGESLLPLASKVWEARQRLFTYKGASEQESTTKDTIPEDEQ